MSSPDINYPAQPSYGESLAEALKAQANFLKGTGDFAETGSLESLLPLEESVRKKTAQTDTDVLRQTLLGTETKTKVVRDPKTGKFGIPDGEIVLSSSGPAPGQFQMIRGADGSMEIMDTSTGGILNEEQTFEKLGYIEPTGQMSKWDRKMDGMDATEFKEYRLTAKGQEAGIQLAQGGRLEQAAGAKYGKAGEVGILTPSGFG